MANRIVLHFEMDTNNLKFVRGSSSRVNISYIFKIVNQDEEMNETSSNLRRFAKCVNTIKVLEKSDCFEIVFLKSIQVRDAREIV